MVFLKDDKMHFFENIDFLLRLLHTCNLTALELNYRKQALANASGQPGSSINCVSDRYYELAHEIKCFHFLTQYGNISIAEDCRHTAGCDCLLNEKYQIECVCCSSGNKSALTGLEQLCMKNNLDGKLIDYDKKKNILFCRLTNSLDEKLKFYHKHIKNGTLSKNLPYIVFLGLGSLAYELFLDDYGIEFTSILYGKGNPTLFVNLDSGHALGNGFSYKRTMLNHNNAEINCTLFSSAEYRSISGIIISDATLDEEYTQENTWFFLNPNAHIKINPEHFHNIIYWDKYNETEYGPYRNGEKLGNT